MQASTTLTSRNPQRSLPGLRSCPIKISRYITHVPHTTATPLPRTAQLFHALSDEARLRIVDILLDGEHCVCDLMDHLDVGQSRLSYHLKVLKDAGLVADRREGRWAYYTIQRDAIVEAERLLSALRPRAGRAVRATCC